ncbi:MAG TPA: HAD-IIIA family hydrolase [Vitreimonas sp.]|uniref:HAD-IIIA family hydrolase n=1 Tax=Vitreimonas sp. TaxID=3069702 RepID=UPI002D47EC01|nr:HAD-IIIA family hydrolase [Vitreimonas sp.]HYD87727.1 HAD-IIIA family hydrolase [Vitreimonas sp.]
MRQAVILVGGRGTRLGELARDTPKPLVRIAGETRFLDYLLHNIARHGVAEILLLAGHLAEQVRAEYHEKQVLGATVRVIAEPAPAGTAGALRHGAAALDDVFLMANGDSFFDLNYLALAEALRPDDIGAMALRRVGDAARFGRVELEGDRVVAFHEKDAAFKGEALISAGVYVLRKSVLDRIARTPCSIETDIFPGLAAERRLAGRESQGYFIDIGLPETLGEARASFVDQMRRSAALFDRDGTLTVDEGYTYKTEALAWQPGAIDAVRAVNDSGALAIVVTNQAGIARGLYSEADMRRFHAHMQSELAKHGAHIDAFYHCPHHGEGCVAQYAHDNHPDRKPNAGMLRRALLEWPIDRARCFLVGDSELDVQAASAIGLKSFRVAPGELLGAVQQGLATLPPARSVSAHAAAQLQERAAQAKDWLFRHALPLWWSKGYDQHARCFHERIGLDGAPVANLARRIRVQARQTVVYARAGDLGWNGPWRAAVAAGADVLLSRGLRADGGTRHLLSPAGEPHDDRRDLYDLAFVLFALAEAGRVLQRDDCIAAAENLLAWAEANWAHPNGGFREGDVTPTPPRRQNPHMHMFEALLALHEATGKTEHLDRAGAIAQLFRDTFFDHGHGALPEYFDEAWRPEPDPVIEPGHHFEWSWLLHRFSALGGANPGDIPERLRVHAELYGVDPASGVTYDEVHIDGRARTPTSRFWPHTERIKANVARFERTRDPAAAAAAAQAFDVLMSYCDVPTKGLWRDRRRPDGSFVDEPAPASSFYHAMFAMFELIRVAETLD